ncbi:MAG: NUDIX domain-containing protein [Flavobacteriaceae bacterium]|nr:NUDIX domain-containing protein [Flavobacteriaceae bacterium]
MDEWVDILDENGNATGRTCLKSEAHAKGWFHPCVHIWFYTSNGDILVQQRGANKKTYPLLWDVSVAGHMAAGETSEEAALREVEEEIGLRIKEADLQQVGVYKSLKLHKDGLIDAEFLNTFLHPLTVSVTNLVPQESEVADIKLISLQEFISVLHEPLTQGHVPHDEVYINGVLDLLRKQL